MLPVYFFYVAISNGINSRLPKQAMDAINSEILRHAPVRATRAFQIKKVYADKGYLPC
jgi:hypothetical protein